MKHSKSHPKFRTVRRTALSTVLLAGLAGCATYHALPLPKGADLKPDAAELRHVVPATGPGTRARLIPVDKPLSIDGVGMLAILNDPALRSERGESAAAQAGLIQASLLPNPSVGLDYAAVLGGPASSPAYTASLSQDINALVTYRARASAARARASQIDAELLWREWQVAQKARLLAFDLYWGKRSIRLIEREGALLNGTAKRVRAAVRAGDLEQSALAPLLAAKASADASLAALRLAQLKNWQSLDALLGMVPNARFAIARPKLIPPPKQLDRIISGLPERRPDLVALKLGYRAADRDVRAAILGQFPALALGVSWNSDTSRVRTLGPSVTFDLPIFDHNQGRIAQTRATRQVLHAQYQSRLDRAVGEIHALKARMRSLTAALAQASRAATSAGVLAARARATYARGDLDQRALTDYETTALLRRIEVMDLRRNLGEAQIALRVELGLGLPQTRLASMDTGKQP